MTTEEKSILSGYRNKKKNRYKHIPRWRDKNSDT